MNAGASTAALLVMLAGCGGDADPDLVAVVEPLRAERFWALHYEGQHVGWEGERHEILAGQDPPVAVRHLRRRTWIPEQKPFAEDRSVTFALSGRGAIRDAFGTYRFEGMVCESRAEPIGAGGMRIVVGDFRWTEAFEIPEPRETLRAIVDLRHWLAGARSVPLVVHHATWPLSPEDPAEAEVRFETARDFGFVAGLARFELTGTVDGEPARWELLADGSLHRLDYGPWSRRAQLPAAAMAVVPNVWPIYTELGPGGLKRLVLEWRHAGPVPETPWQSVRQVDADTLRISIRGGSELVREPASLVELSAAERQRWTRPDRWHDFDHPTVAARIARIDRSATASEGAIRKLMAIVDETIEFEIDDRTRPASQVVARGRGDCSDFTALFVALARACGWPARSVVGLAYGSATAPPSFCAHAWAEIHVDGRWIPVDPLWGQVHVDATHITLGHGLTMPDGVGQSLDLRVVSFERER